MARKPKVYRRLPGRGTALAHYVRLYQGPDHFLLVSSTGFTENYKRFYFRDIQGFVVEKKFWHHLWTVLWAGMVAMVGLPAMLADGAAFVVLSCIAGLFLLILLLNLAMGPSCACHIQTAVQTEKLPTLKRARSARKFIRRVQPVLTTAQTEAAGVAGPGESSPREGTRPTGPVAVTGSSEGAAESPAQPTAPSAPSVETT